ncbi:hypothetical protein NIES4101_46090 [Calothrix sp. NIES-4101]|nr:hypothetical protein NIES4101_46090 [Calothrix sp. NIES-4101]
MNWEEEIKQAILPTPQLEPEPEPPVRQPTKIDDVPNTIDNVGLLLALSDTKPNYGTK